MVNITDKKELDAEDIREARIILREQYDQIVNDLKRVMVKMDKILEVAEYAKHQGR